MTGRVAKRYDGSIRYLRAGVTRAVLLIGPYAIKFPKVIDGWKLFLCGLLANMQERQFSRGGWAKVCPVLFALPGGFLIVMERTRPLTDDEWDKFDPKIFCDCGDYVIPAEHKPDSFGVGKEGLIYAIDYGN